MRGVTGGTMRIALAAGCVVMSLVLVCGICVASEGAGGHDGGRVLDLLYRFINFGLLVVILFVVIRKTTIKDFFSARRKEIAETFERLRQDKDEAERRYRELETQLEEFEVRKKEILERFKAEGEAEKARIIEAARQKAAHILDQVDGTIQRELQNAKDRLREEVVTAAALKAEEIIAREMSDGDQDNLVDEFIKRVEKLH